LSQGHETVQRCDRGDGFQQKCASHVSKECHEVYQKEDMFKKIKSCSLRSGPLFCIEKFNSAILIE